VRGEYLEHQQSITVLGGSAASSFSDREKISWPYLLKAELPQDITFKIETRPSLTFVRALNELIDFPNEDLLILHFGTSIGWPSSVVRIGHKMGIDFTSEVAFHQAAYKSSGLMNQLRKRSRARFRNTVKYLIFFLGYINRGSAGARLQTKSIPWFIWRPSRASASSGCNTRRCRTAGFF
jgi:hypothetical protein